MKITCICECNMIKTDDEYITIYDEKIKNYMCRNPECQFYLEVHRSKQLKSNVYNLCENESKNYIEIINKQLFIVTQDSHCEVKFICNITQKLNPKRAMETFKKVINLGAFL